MITFNSYFQESIRRRTADNISHLIEEINNGIIKDRFIRSKLEAINIRAGLSPNFDLLKLLDTLPNDDHLKMIALSILIPNPLRQNISEATQIEYIQRYSGITMNKLPTGGQNSIRITSRGQLIFHDKKQKVNHKITKSFDFWFERRKKKYYVVSKVTNYSGGSQDNQHADVVAFLEYAKKNKDKGVMFVALLDGEYWVDAKDMKNVYQDNKKILILNSDEFVAKFGNKKFDNKNTTL